MRYQVIAPKHQGKAISGEIPAEVMHAALHGAILKTKLYPDKKKDETTVERVLEDVTAQLKPLPHSDIPRGPRRQAYKEVKEATEILGKLKNIVEGCISLYSVNDVSAEMASIKSQYCSIVAERFGLDGNANQNFAKKLDENLTAAVTALEKQYETFSVTSAEHMGKTFYGNLSAKEIQTQLREAILKTDVNDLKTYDLHATTIEEHLQLLREASKRSDAFADPQAAHHAIENCIAAYEKRFDTNLSKKDSASLIMQGDNACEKLAQSLGFLGGDVVIAKKALNRDLTAAVERMKVEGLKEPAQKARR